LARPRLPDVARLPTLARVFILIASLYLFFVSIALLSDGFRAMGQGFAQTLLGLAATPVAGVFVGLLATSIVQSSSCTTSLVVGLVASGTIDIPHAIPIIMGANIGTTVTNTLVSFVHVGRPVEFERAFPASIVHDFFNILTVAVLLPVEVLFHPLARTSGLLAHSFQGIGGLTAASPLKAVTQPAADLLARVLHPPVVTIVIAIFLLFLGLKYLVDSMRSLVNRRFELVLDRWLFRNATTAFLLGLVFTSIVQSSSVTTSLVVPMAGAGLLTLNQIFPYTLGANIGTTVTAILAALVTGSVGGIQIAFAHLGFNILGTAIWYPLRFVPIRMAAWWGRFCARHRGFALVYMIVVFYVIPLFVVLLTRRR
jgi:sodium-dependent phosphate cotransporter